MPCGVLFWINWVSRWEVSKIRPLLRSFPGLKDFAVGTLNFRAYGPFPGCYMTSSSLTIDDSSPIQVISRSRFKENQESHRASTLEAEKTEQSLKNTQLPPRSPSLNRKTVQTPKKEQFPPRQLSGDGVWIVLVPSGHFQKRLTSF